MNYKPEELLHKLKASAQLPNLIVAYGEEDYYRKQLSDCVVDYVYADTPLEDREIRSFEKDTNLGELEGTINTYPFFSGKSLIVLRDDKLLGKAESDSAKKQQERLAKILSDIPEYCTVFINAKKMDARTKFFKSLQQGAVCNCEPVKVYNLGDWLERRAAVLGGRLSRDAQERVMEYLGPLDNAPMQLLTQELEKLAVYAGERKLWTKEDVDTVFSALPEVGRFALTNALAEHKLLQVLELLAAEKKKGTPVIVLCGSIMYQVRRMLQIKELQQKGYNVQQIGEALNIKYTGIINRSVNQCGRFEEKYLREALLALAQLNIDLRRGGRQYDRLEEILVRLLS